MKLFRTVLALVLVCVLVILGAQWLNDPALRRFGQVVVQVGGWARACCSTWDSEAGCHSPPVQVSAGLGLVGFAGPGFLVSH